MLALLARLMARTNNHVIIGGWLSNVFLSDFTSRFSEQVYGAEGVCASSGYAALAARFTLTPSPQTKVVSSNPEPSIHRLLTVVYA
jgi:hypothetical protein